MTRTPAVLPLVAALLLGPLAGSADATTSWSTLLQVHGAKTQACRVSAQGGDAWRIRLRLVNGSAHTHLAGGSVQRDGREVDEVSFRVAPHRTSDVKSVLVRRGGSDMLVVGMGETTGEGLGGDVQVSDIGRC